MEISFLRRQTNLKENYIKEDLISGENLGQLVVASLLPWQRFPRVTHTCLLRGLKCPSASSGDTCPDFTFAGSRAVRQ